MADITGDGSNETINGTNDPDSLIGGGGNDTIDGLGGNDTIDGDGALAAIRTVFQWSAFGLSDEDDFDGGAGPFSQTLNGVTVDLTVTVDNGTNIEYETGSTIVTGIDIGPLPAADPNSSIEFESNSG